MALAESKTRNAILTTIARTPGLRYSDLRTLSKQHGGSMLDIADLEQHGYVASIRVGLHRGFYLAIRTQNSQQTRTEQTNDPIATRILRAVAQTPGTWEGQLARDLALSQQIVHYHLKSLVNRKMITATAKGRRKLYRASCGTKVREDAVAK